MDLDGDGRQEAVFSGRTWDNVNYRDFFARLSQRDGGLRFDQFHRLPVGELLVDPILLDPTVPASILSVVERDGTGDVLVRFSGPRLEASDIATLPGSTRPILLDDVDADGQVELLATVDGLVTLIDVTTGVVEWTAPIGYQYQHETLGAGQLDGDPALEVVLGDEAGEIGTILDGATRAVEWTFFGGFDGTPRVGEFDGDPGTREFVVVSAWGESTLFTATPFYSPVSSHDTGRAGSILVADMEGDGRDELILGAHNSGTIVAYSLPKWTARAIPFNFGDVQSLAIGQLDTDAAMEFAASGGLESTGPDYAWVVDSQSGELQFSQVDASGPHSTALLADLNADGMEDLAVATLGSEGGIVGGPLLYLVNPQSGRVERVEDDLLGWPWNEIGGALLMAHNLDADPQLELIIGGGYLYDPRLIVRDGVSLAQQYFATDNEDRGILRQHLIQFNGDGIPDIVAAVGSRLLVFDGANGATLWRSTPMTLRGEHTQLTVGNVDGDEAQEILVTTQGGITIFDALTQSLQSHTPMAQQALGISVERTNDSCLIVVLELDRLVRRDCAASAIVSERVYAVPDASLALVPEGSDGRIVLSDGERLYLQEGADVVARSTALGPLLGWDSRAAVKIEGDTVSVYTGDTLAFYRIDLSRSYLFGDGFE
jgi:hypothetical protein